MESSHHRAGRAAHAAGKAAVSAVLAFFFLAVVLPPGLATANAADTKPPAVTITAPVSGATVSGTITVSASASDNRGVVGVQFKYNGINLGTEDTAAPYSVSANTTTVPDGSYTFTAVARDAAGNRTTSAPLTVTVANAPPPDTTSPTVGITSPAAGATVSGTITLTANASDNVGVTGVQFKRDGVNIGTEDTAAPFSIPWNTATATNGSHTLTATARDTTGNVTASAPITVTVANGSTPYTGTPITLPGTIEAENFDLGGEGTAYHDNVAGNAGGQYRPGEDVDIIVSTDPAGGGHVVNNFETGEWLAYTVNVAASGQYDIDIRAATTFTNSAFHLEIDGINVTGSIVVPSTGSWSIFQWIGKKSVTLTAGTHVLKIVSDQQYFNLDAIRVAVAADTQVPSAPSNLAATVISTSRVDLSWSAATDNVGVTGYYVYRNGTRVANIPGTSYSDSGLAAATTYSYAVAAYDATGNVSDQSSAVSATTRDQQLPYSGTPITLPGTIEAENFDLGGEGTAYHDNVAGNAGGQYRPGEDVDIIVSTDPAGGGHVVNNFETGEWLAYTVNVAASGQYDIDIRAATAFTNSAYHVEIDGVNVTGNIVLPGTGGWETYQWTGKKSVALTAGTHLLKIVSDQQYFNLNAIRVSAAPAQGSANRLFSSGFEGATALLAPSDFYGTGAWQGIVGLDNLTGFTWPPLIWGGGSTRFQLLADTAVNVLTIDNYMVNQIQTVTGHDGNPTRALYSEIKQSGCCGTNPQGGRPAQDPFMIQPLGETSDLYISYWLKHQPNLANLMEVGNATSGWNWRVVFEWKTAGDYRVIASIKRDPYFNGGNLYWNIIGDNEANGGLAYQKFWETNNTQVPVAAGQWMKFEVYWHRSSGNDGRVWMAVNGQVIVDRLGPNVGVNNAPINRIMMPNLYSSTAYPIYQWVDNVQIWDGFPPDAAPH